jgi:asparagine N-glycosylation enzyme membrane subunit Stt3
MTPEHSRKWDLLAVLITLAGAAVRYLPWRTVFADGEVLWLDPDVYYHLWRARTIAESFPRVPAFDHFISFPDGAPVPWPPFLDFLVAIPGLWGAGSAVMAQWGAAIIPLFGAIAVFLLYRLGSKVFDPLTGVVSAGLFALMPGAAEFAYVGRVDHHALVAPVILGLFLSYLSATEASGAWRRALWCMAAGALAALSVSAWIVTPFLYFIPVAVAAIGCCRASPDAGVRSAGIMTLGASAVLVMVVVFFAGDLRRHPFELYQPSLFIVAQFAVAALAAPLAAARPRRALVSLVAAVVLVAVAAFFSPRFFAPIREAIGVVRGEDPSYVIPMEAASVLTPWCFFYVIEHYSYIVLLWPFMAAAFSAAVLRRGFSAGGTLVVSYALLGSVLLFLQYRFGEYAAPALSLLIGWSVAAAARRFAAFVGSAPVRWRAWLLGTLAAVALAASFWQAPSLWRAMMNEDNTAYLKRFFRFGRELSSVLPPVDSGPDAPSYGVLTKWDDGHPLLWASGRPVIASSFGTREALSGNRAAFRALLSTDEETAYRETAKRRLRFVLVSPVLFEVEGMAAIAGVPQEFVAFHDGGDAEALPQFARTLHSRLFFGDGTSGVFKGERIAPLSNFRLMVESKTRVTRFGRTVPEFKAFEGVPGARLSGRAAPGTPVKAAVTVRTNTGREFAYRRETEAGARGEYEITVPYSTRNGTMPTGAAGPYRVSVGEETFELHVGESDVLEGRVVPVP